MAFLDEATRKRIRPLLRDLAHEVELEVRTGGMLVLPGRDATGHQQETLALLQEVAESSDRITVRESPLAGDAEAQALGITRAPTILFRRRGEARSNLRYAGLPSGHEFTVLLEAIRLVASDEPPEDAVGELPETVLVQTFVTPECPHCPRAVLSGYELALANDRIVVEAVEANEFPILRHVLRISSVPDTVLGGRPDLRLSGARPKRELVDAIRRAAGVAA